MKILFYTDTPNVGGAEKQMLLLAEQLSQKGHEVHLAYGNYSLIKSLQPEFEKWCKKIHIIPTIHKHDPRHLFHVRRILGEGNFDLIHIHLWNPGAGRYAFFAANQKGVPIITTEHDPFELEGMKRGIKNRCLKRTSHHIVISHENYKLMEEYYDVPEERLHLVHNGIELEPFSHHDQKAELPIQTGDIVISCVAELHERKGHRYLIEAFEKLQIHFPQLRLILVGRGSLEDQLKEQCRDNNHIHFLGWRNDIPDILNASDIFVLPSLKEAFGLVILEAMASGVVAVSTNNGGVVDIIENGKTGYLVPPANSEKLAETLEVILRNPDQKRDIEKAALERVRGNFTAEKMTERTIEVYEKI